MSKETVSDSSSATLEHEPEDFESGDVMDQFDLSSSVECLGEMSITSSLGQTSTGNMTSRNTPDASYMDIDISQLGDDSEADAFDDFLYSTSNEGQSNLGFQTPGDVSREPSVYSAPWDEQPPAPASLRACYPTTRECSPPSSLFRLDPARDLFGPATLARATSNEPCKSGSEHESKKTEDKTVTAKNITRSESRSDEDKVLKDDHRIWSSARIDIHDHSPPATNDTTTNSLEALTERPPTSFTATRASTCCNPPHTFPRSGDKTRDSLAASRDPTLPNLLKRSFETANPCQLLTQQHCQCVTSSAMRATSPFVIPLPGTTETQPGNAHQVVDSTRNLSEIPHAKGSHIPLSRKLDQEQERAETRLPQLRGLLGVHQETTIRQFPSLKRGIKEPNNQIQQRAADCGIASSSLPSSPTKRALALAQEPLPYSPLDPNFDRNHIVECSNIEGGTTIEELRIYTNQLTQAHIHVQLLYPHPHRSSLKAVLHCPDWLCAWKLVNRRIMVNGSVRNWHFVHDFSVIAARVSRSVEYVERYFEWLCRHVQKSEIENDNMARAHEEKPSKTSAAERISELRELEKNDDEVVLCESPNQLGSDEHDAPGLFNPIPIPAGNSNPTAIPLTSHQGQPTLAAAYTKSCSSGQSMVTPLTSKTTFPSPGDIYGRGLTGEYSGEVKDLKGSNAVEKYIANDHSWKRRIPPLETPNPSPQRLKKIHKEKQETMREEEEHNKSLNIAQTKEPKNINLTEKPELKDRPGDDDYLNQEHKRYRAPSPAIHETYSKASRPIIYRPASTSASMLGVGLRPIIDTVTYQPLGEPRRTLGTRRIRKSVSCGSFQELKQIGRSQRGKYEGIDEMKGSERFKVHHLAIKETSHSNNDAERYLKETRALYPHPRFRYAKWQAVFGNDPRYSHMFSMPTSAEILSYERELIANKRECTNKATPPSLDRTHNPPASNFSGRHIRYSSIQPQLPPHTSGPHAHRDYSFAHGASHIPQPYSSSPVSSFVPDPPEPHRQLGAEFQDAQQAQAKQPQATQRRQPQAAGEGQVEIWVNKTQGNQAQLPNLKYNHGVDILQEVLQNAQDSFHTNVTQPAPGSQRQRVAAQQSSSNSMPASLNKGELMTSAYPMSDATVKQPQSQLGPSNYLLQSPQGFNYLLRSPDTPRMPGRQSAFKMNSASQKVEQGFSDITITTATNQHGLTETKYRHKPKIQIRRLCSG
ncbi:hypothetical protein B0O99DRAFT_597522 [Bisporella sp. PMI_857]|nr:hypothetical protein B0O99DRAFT_597522 [Bisporella sp. PMI_857]